MVEISVDSRGLGAEGSWDALKVLASIGLETAKMPAAVGRSERVVSVCFRLGPRGILAQAVRGHS
jgi:hypothetical protein